MGFFKKYTWRFWAKAFEFLQELDINDDAPTSIQSIYLVFWKVIL